MADADRPTIKQIEFIKSLAKRAGADVNPGAIKTRREASALIDELRTRAEMAARENDRPSKGQLDYIESLCAELHIAGELSTIRTKEEAARRIDELARDVKVRPATRTAVFAAMNAAGIEKEAMYAACKITSLADINDAREADALRCLRWLRGETVEVSRPHRPSDDVYAPLADAAAAVRASAPVVERPPASEDDPDWIPYTSGPLPEIEQWRGLERAMADLREETERMAPVEMRVFAEPVVQPNPNLRFRRRVVLPVKKATEPAEESKAEWLRRMGFTEQVRRNPKSTAPRWDGSPEACTRYFEWLRERDAA